MGTSTTDDVALSLGQARFAEEHDARVGLHRIGGEGEVFLYHNDPWVDCRWLVDLEGRAVEATRFRKSPPSWVEREHASRHPRIRRLARLTRHS
jgi:hypothetical protein